MAGLADAAGFVLVGGRSSRMGSDKALKLHRGMPLASHIAGQMLNVTDSVALVGDPNRYGSLGHPVISDEFPGKGPIGGILSALRSSGSTWNIVVACDLPAVTPALFTAMLQNIQRTGYECLIPVTPDGREQVLCAVYRKDAAHSLQTAWTNGSTRLRDAVRKLRTSYWPVESGEWAVNLNTPADWDSYSRRER